MGKRERPKRLPLSGRARPISVVGPTSCAMWPIKLKRSQARCVDEARAIYQAGHRQQAIKEFRAWQARWIKEAPEAVRCLESDLEALLEFFECPRPLWKKLRTTTAIERLFVEVRRRIRTMCAFTTRSSCERILYAVFNRMNDQWTLHPLKDFTQNN